MVKQISIILLSTILFSGGNREGTSRWKIVHTRDDIIVSERWVTFSDGVKTRERKGEFTMEADPDELLSLLKDADKTTQWMRAVSEHKIIAAKKPAEWYSYTVYDIPWPFKSQDMISYYQWEKLSGNHGYKLKIKSVDNHMPAELIGIGDKESSLKRLSQYQAEWLIERKISNLCSVRFTASSRTPPPFPRWMMDPILIRVFEDNLSRFKEMALNNNRGI